MTKEHNETTYRLKQVDFYNLLSTQTSHRGLEEMSGSWGRDEERKLKGKWNDHSNKEDLQIRSRLHGYQLWSEWESLDLAPLLEEQGEVPRSIQIPLESGFSVGWAPNGYGKTFVFEALASLKQHQSYADWFHHCKSQIITVPPSKDMFPFHGLGVLMEDSDGSKVVVLFFEPSASYSDEFETHRDHVVAAVSTVEDESPTSWLYAPGGSWDIVRAADLEGDESSAQAGLVRAAESALLGLEVEYVETPKLSNQDFEQVLDEFTSGILPHIDQLADGEDAGRSQADPTTLSKLMEATVRTMRALRDPLAQHENAHSFMDELDAHVPLMVDALTDPDAQISVDQLVRFLQCILFEYSPLYPLHGSRFLKSLHDAVGNAKKGDEKRVSSLQRLLGRYLIWFDFQLALLEPQTRLELILHRFESPSDTQWDVLGEVSRRIRQIIIRENIRGHPVTQFSPNIVPLLREARKNERIIWPEDAPESPDTPYSETTGKLVSLNEAIETTLSMPLSAIPNRLTSATTSLERVREALNFCLSQDENDWSINAECELNFKDEQPELSVFFKTAAGRGLDPKVLSFGMKSELVMQMKLCLHLCTANAGLESGYFAGAFTPEARILVGSTEANTLRMLVLDEAEVGRSEHWTSILIYRLMLLERQLAKAKGHGVMVISHRGLVLEHANSLGEYRLLHGIQGESNEDGSTE